MIQTLFNSDMDEKGVNAYTGHSQRSTTAPNYHYYLSKNGVGFKLCALPSDRVCLSAEANWVIQVDDVSNKDEEWARLSRS
jgi:hypothetical protein